MTGTAITRRRALLTGAAFAALYSVGGRTELAARAGNDAAGTLPYTGVNLAGADFGKVPGKHGTEYLYPTTANVDYFAARGFNLVRLPFKWERLQPNLGEAFFEDERARLRKIVAYTTGKGLTVVIDPHNYAKRRVSADGWAKEYLIGSQIVPTASFADFWSRLAADFKDNPNVMLGLMNEPANIKADAWLRIANAAIAAIRQAGATNLILVPGVDYTGAHSWISSKNTIMGDVADPLKNIVFEVHQYLDRDSSGRSPEAVSATIGSERIRAFQNWAREGGHKAFLGEFNGGRNETGYAALADILREMQANPDVWIGWAAWAGGPRWPEDEMFNLQPTKSGEDREQTKILASFAQARSAE